MVLEQKMTTAQEGPNNKKLAKKNLHGSEGPENLRANMTKLSWCFHWRLPEMMLISVSYHHNYK